MMREMIRDITAAVDNGSNDDRHNDSCIDNDRNGNNCYHSMIVICTRPIQFN